MKSLIILFFVIFGYEQSKCSTIITGKINNNIGETFYFKPHKNHRNSEFAKKIEVNPNGELQINLDITKPFFVKIISNGINFALFIKPGDSLHFEINEENNQLEKNQLKIHGQNADGQNYFNNIFNKTPFNKFIKIRELISKTDIENGNTNSLNEIFLEIEKQTKWADSLYYQNKIDNEFRTYMKDDISAILASELISYTNNKLESKSLDSSTKAKIILIQDEIFNKYSPQKNTLRCGLFAPSYIFNYYLTISKRIEIDQSKVICEDAPHISLMEYIDQEYFWGFDISAVLKFAPESEFLCKSILDYYVKFPNNSFNEYFNLEEVCSKTKVKNEVKIIDIKSTDFFSLLNNFPGKRLYIDLWATWCGPCKMEFNHYTEELYKKLNDKNIVTLFLSIDEEKSKDTWQKQINNFKLKGFHGIVNRSLMESIHEIIFDKKEISIPRYILVDKDSKVISWNAPRPSDYQLLSLLNTLH